MRSESTMKAAKRVHNANYITRETVYNSFTGELEIEVKFNMLPQGPHAPNKQEAKALRRICSQTGLRPEEVREHKKYRKELAEAAKSSEKIDGKVTGSYQRRLLKRLLNIRKSIARETGLCHHHPDFFSFFEKEWNNVYWRYPFYQINSAHEAFNLIK